MQQRFVSYSGSCDWLSLMPNLVRHILMGHFIFFLFALYSILLSIQTWMIFGDCNGGEIFYGKTTSEDLEYSAWTIPLRCIFCLFLLFLLHRKRIKVIQVWNKIRGVFFFFVFFWWTISCILSNHRSCQIFSVQMSNLSFAPFDLILLPISPGVLVLH